MPDGVSAYPLAWPAHRARTPAADRRDGRFTTKTGKRGAGYVYNRPVTLADARERLMRELDLLRAALPVLSTNVELRLDGQPRSGQRDPADPGAALYFRLGKRPIALACDRYTTVAANIAAIAAHIDATRAIERHGVGTLDEAFAGFAQLPTPGPPSWRAALGFGLADQVTRDAIRARRHELARQHHPDVGGSAARMSEINAAAEQALKELGDG